MYLIQILLPSPGGNDAPVQDARFAQTRAELVERFRGVTAYLWAPAQGAWTSPDGRLEHDEMVMVEVLTDAFDRGWWRAYAERLAQRFEQETIHVRALSAETP